MSEADQILAVLRESVLDEEERFLTAERFSADPLAWQLSAEDWGVSTLPIRSDPDEAQADAERCRAALMAAGWADQADAGVCATFDHKAGGWRGCINLDFGLLPPTQFGNGVPYERASDRM